MVLDGVPPLVLKMVAFDIEVQPMDTRVLSIGFANTVKETIIKGSL